MIPQFADQLALLAVVAVIAAEVVVLAWRHPPVGLWLFMAAYLAQIGGWNLETVALGFQVYPLDIVAALLLAVSALRLRNVIALSRPIIVIGLLLALAIARGLSEFGAATSFNGSRAFIYVIAGVIFARVCLVGRWYSIELVWFVAAAALAVVATLFIARNGLGTYSSTGERPLNSGQALIVAQASLLALATNRPGHGRLGAIAGFGLVVLSQQRTVWIATLAMALVLAYRPSGEGNGRTRRTVRVGLGGALLGSIALVLISPPELSNSLTTATSDDATLSWRAEGWRFFIDEFGSRGLGEKLVGQPSGRTLERVINTAIRTESAHNMYVQVLVTLGLLGLAALVILYVGALRRSWRANPVLASVIVGLCVFSIGYQIESVQGIWIGFALSLAAAHSTSRSPVVELQTT
jgi:hypothetical protein